MDKQLWYPYNGTIFILYEVLTDATGGKIWKTLC